MKEKIYDVLKDETKSLKPIEIYHLLDLKTSEELDEFMDTSIGKWFISVNNKLKSKNELLSNLDKFSSDANIMMKSDDKIRRLKYGEK